MKIETEPDASIGVVTDNTTLGQSGLTKREYFAEMAMQGIISDHTFIKPNEPYEVAEKGC